MRRPVPARGRWGEGGGKMAAAAERGQARDVPPLARRRSDRLSATENEESLVPAVKHSIVLKKIKPQRKLTVGTTATPRRSPRVSAEAVKENVCRVSAGSGAPEGQVSPSLPVTATPSAEDSDLLLDTRLPSDRDSVMSHKVRRSYSRLSPFGTQAGNASDGSDTSTPNQWHPARRSFFGFERLLATEALPAISPVKSASPRDKPAGLPAPGSAACVPPGAIPGVAAAKEKRKKRKVAQIEKSALDEWAAQMNASFEEAERFDLVVE
ncbi:sororin [Pristis pectinata]|uniref:sororin n=1 Tax=Pristis pectinata TaxID=685728 RepID=UPI00223CE0C8|nr:sororin [Pristis pectinata]